MAFDIPNFHIEPNSPEGRALQDIIQRQRVTPEEAVRRALRQLPIEPAPADEMWGAFSSVEDSKLLDEVVSEAYRRRVADEPRDFGI